MISSPVTPSLPLTASTDAAALARLRTLPQTEAETLLGVLLALKTHAERQDYLIANLRIAVSLPVLDAWLIEAQRARDERRFSEYLAEVQRAAERAEAFRDLLARSEQLHQVNIVLLAVQLFDALVSRDQAAIENLARSFAEVVGSLNSNRTPQPQH